MKSMQRRFDNLEPDDFWDIEVECPDCKGEGHFQEDSEIYTCKLCGGSGEITMDSRQLKKQHKEHRQLEALE